MAYTYSKLSSYKSCPRKFKFAYIDKIKVPQKECFKKGTEIHSFLEKYDSHSSNKIVDNFFKSELGSEIKDVLINHKTLRELKFGLDSDFNPCNYSDKNALYRGIVDLVFYKDGVLNLVDYKTGKYKDIKYQDFNQLLSYSLNFFASNKIDKIKLRYVYIEHNIENSLEITRDSIEHTKSFIFETIKTIESDKEFNKKESFLCNWCEYKTICKGI